MPTVYLWEYWWSCVPFCYTLEEVKSLPQVNKNLFGWKHLNLFLRIFTKPCFSLFYDWSSFRVLFSRYSFLHNFSLLQFHWKKAREMIYYNCMNTAGEKAALLHHEKAALWKLLHHAKHKIHKNNKMHFYKNYNSTLYNTDSPCWIILFPRHLSYHHTTTTTIRPSWHLMFYIFTGNLSRCFTYISEFMSLYLTMH